MGINFQVALIESLGYREFLIKRANQKRYCWEYEQSKAFLQILEVHSMKEFKWFYSAGRIPEFIPKNPHAYYSKRGGCVSYVNFFSKDNIELSKNIDYTSEELSFTEKSQIDCRGYIEIF
jgi:hypothetical protein